MLQPWGGTSSKSAAEGEVGDVECLSVAIEDRAEERAGQEAGPEEGFHRAPVTSVLQEEARSMDMAEASVPVVTMETVKPVDGAEAPVTLPAVTLDEVGSMDGAGVKSMDVAGVKSIDLAEAPVVTLILIEGVRSMNVAVTPVSVVTLELERVRFLDRALAFLSASAVISEEVRFWDMGKALLLEVCCVLTICCRHLLTTCSHKLFLKYQIQPSAVVKLKVV